MARMSRLPLLAVFALGCGASRPALSAHDAYEAEQSACVAAYSTRAEIDACRAEVRARWGVTRGAP